MGFMNEFRLARLFMTSFLPSDIFHNHPTLTNALRAMQGRENLKAVLCVLNVVSSKKLNYPIIAVIITPRAKRKTAKLMPIRRDK